MIILPAQDRLIITSGVPLRSIVGKSRPKIINHAGVETTVKSKRTIALSKGVHVTWLPWKCSMRIGCQKRSTRKINPCPVGSNRWPGWESVARPARLNPGTSKGKGKGKGNDKGNEKKERTTSLEYHHLTQSLLIKQQKVKEGKGVEALVREGLSHVKQLNQKRTRLPDRIQKVPMWYQKTGRIMCMTRFPLYKMLGHLLIMWRHMCKEPRTYLPSGLYGLLQQVSQKEKFRYHLTDSRILTFGAFQMRMPISGNPVMMVIIMSP